MKTPISDRQFLTRADVADLLGMSPEWVRSRLEDGSIAYYKLGRSVRISVEDLEAFLAAAHRAGGER